MSEEALSNDQIQEEPEEGVPDWVVTFGDLMSLLLCFFVLMLSFSEMDRKKYRQVSGSMKNAFGIQRQKPIFDSPKGLKMISREFDQSIVLPQMKAELARAVEVVEPNYTRLTKLVEIESGENTLTIRMMGETTFDTGKATVRQQFTSVLQQIVSILDDTEGEILIAGHTDNVPLRGGRFGSNLGLSAARAAAVGDFFLKHSNIDPRRLSTMGLGEYRPIASNQTAGGRQRNRRVEIVLTK